MDMTHLPAKPGTYQLQDYERMREVFKWEDVHKHFSWFKTEQVNIAHEAIDRHANDPQTRDQVALIHYASGEERCFTFDEMRQRSNQFANVLKKYGINKGDRVFLFLPRTPQFYITFFGILKTGAIAGPLFESFMEQAIYDRLYDSEARMLITTKELYRRVPHDRLPELEAIILIDCDESEPSSHKYINYQREMNEASTAFAVEWVDLEDGMLMHYTSGSTGKPKGVYHAHRMMVQQYITAEWVLDLQEDDVYWCTADVGWMAGTSYGILAPWLKGVTTVVYDGEYTPESLFGILEKYHITVWYTSPILLRKLVSTGDLIHAYDLSSIRHILSVGELLSPEIITWGLKNFRVRVHDTWLMTETGAQVIANFPALEMRPGSMGKPIPGIEAIIMDHEGNELPPYQMGNLAIKKGWPAMMKAIWNHPNTYESYFMNDWFLTGDHAYKDEDGYFWFQGRLDEVFKTPNERIGPFEIESKLIEHPAVHEAGVIAIPDPIKGEEIKAFITLNDGYETSEELLKEIRNYLEKKLSAHAAPHMLEVKEQIPKTRSGKIMRRQLKSWEIDKL
ncbi:MAG TPA: acetate--CoA ligase [Bacillota bacterium]|nr:acetate--CoA ligase [Bacillota bacterium]